MLIFSICAQFFVEPFLVFLLEFVPSFFMPYAILCVIYCHCLLTPFYNVENFISHPFHFYSCRVLFKMISFADAAKAYLDVSHFEFPFSSISLYLSLALYYSPTKEDH